MAKLTIPLGSYLTNYVNPQAYTIGSSLPGYSSNYSIGSNLTNYVNPQTYRICSSLPVHVQTDFTQIVIRDSTKLEQAINDIAIQLKAKIIGQDLSQNKFISNGQDLVWD